MVRKESRRVGKYSVTRPGEGHALLLHRLTGLFICCVVFPAAVEGAIISGLSPAGLLSSPPVRAKVEEARALFKKGDSKGAQKTLDALVSATPGLPPARLILAKLCL